MKIKFIVFLTLCFVLCTALFSLTACSLIPSAPHEHKFISKRISEEYLASPATCVAKAKYFYACECGEKGGTTFEHGEFGDHSYGDWVSKGNGLHTKTCKHDSTHTVTENCSGGTATYTERAVCVDCGEEYGALLLSEFIFTLNEDNESYTINIFTEEIISNYESAEDFRADYEQISSLKEITIPSKYNGLPVTAIGDYAFAAMCFEKVNIPNTITTIGDFAFGVCEYLKSITIPDSVTYIGEFAFINCVSLSTITIGNKVNYIGAEAFSACVSLTSVTIPESVCHIDYYAFSMCFRLVEVINKSASITFTNNYFDNGYFVGTVLSVSNCDDDYVSKVSTDKNGFVIYTEGNEKILVGYNGLKPHILEGSSFEESTNSENKGNTDVVIPEGIVKVNAWAFAGLSELTSVIIPNSVTSIGVSAFEDCSSLTSVIIPNSVTSIGDYAFSGCTSLTSIEIPNSVTSIDHGVFSSCTSLTSVIIPNSVTSIGDCAFLGCSSLTSVTIPNSVTSIGYSAFSHCSSLTSVTIGNSVTYIGDRAFYGCDSLTSIVIPDSVTSIGDYAFSSCSSLTSVTIGDSVTNIGYYAFAWCSSLKYIYCQAESQPESWDSDWKYNCPAKVVWGYNVNKQ